MRVSTAFNKLLRLQGATVGGVIFGAEGVAFLLKEQLRELYHHVDPAAAAAYLKDWLAWASRSKLKPFVKPLIALVHLCCGGVEIDPPFS